MASALSKVTRSSLGSRRSRNSLRSASSMGLINEIKESNSEMRSELQNLKGMLQSTTHRLATIEPKRQRTATHGRRGESWGNFTAAALRSHDELLVKKPRQKTERSDISGGLHGAEGELETRQVSEGDGHSEGDVEVCTPDCAWAEMLFSMQKIKL